MTDAHCQTQKRLLLEGRACLAACMTMSCSSTLKAGLRVWWDPTCWCCHASQMPASPVVKHSCFAEMPFILFFVPFKTCRHLVHSDCRQRNFLSASPLPLFSTPSREEHHFKKGLTFLLNRAQEIKHFLQCPDKEID